MNKNNNHKDSRPPSGGETLKAAETGPTFRQWYARMPTAELARQTGLTVKQIENYMYRHNTEPWARKLDSVISAENSVKGKKGGGRPKKPKIRN